MSIGSIKFRKYRLLYIFKVVKSQNEVTESVTESSSSYCIKIDNNKDRLTYSSAEITTKEKLEEHIKLLDAKIDWASNQVQLIFYFLITYY